MSDGKGCKCGAYYSRECACDADWSCGECAKLRAENGKAMRAALHLAKSIRKTEYAKDATQWEPCDTLIGIISQIDNMYAGVRNERDKLREENGRLKSFVRDFAEEPCHYGDNCPPFVKLNHYECRNCRARRMLDKR